MEDKDSLLFTTLKQDGYVRKDWNIDNQFDGTMRRHYQIQIIATVYDADGDNPEHKTIYDATWHLTKKELQALCDQLVQQNLKNHYQLSAVAIPHSFEVVSVWEDTPAGTTAEDSGQLRMTI